MLTPEQTTLSEAISSRQPVSGRACAGTGKTTTAVSGLQKASGKVLALAFNKSAQTELELRLKPFPNVEAKTLNGLGHRLVMQSLGHKKLRLEINKLRFLCDELFPLLKFEEKLLLQKLVKQARINGMVPDGAIRLKGLIEDTQENWEALVEDLLEEEIVKQARALLNLCIWKAQTEGLIDFDDQIYLSALNPNPIAGWDLCVVDEAQDLNPLQHKMLSKFFRTPIAIIGDPRQSIYGFRGAVSNSMQSLEEKFKLPVLPLTLNFRCAPTIVSYAQQWCPEIRAGLTTTGTVDYINEYDPAEFSSDAAILCRCNAPLLRLAFQLIRNGRWPNFIGRDIGKSLASTLNQITRKENLSEPELSRKIDKFFSHQIEVATERGQDYKIEGLEDRRECLFAVLEVSGARSAQQLISSLKEFAERPGAGITLSSIHRAKGLEWNTVYWLDKHLGEKFSLKAFDRGAMEDVQQENNLMYVAATRAKQNLFFIETNREK
jgi:DNA helicase-2/ATP-dependent DNA helicase PcrA